ncbi:hypothetical protein J3B02_001837 [Coemansia erecta]|nr:hypothetical protein J3B02_001837 [Coemansia erecta]
MDAAEIEVYATKLAEVELALEADPENIELQTLKTEIEDLLALTSELNEHPSASSATATVADTTKQTFRPTAIHTDAQRKFSETSSAATQPTRNWRIGDQCEARYAADGNYYAARVVAVRGGNVFQVAFVGYGDMQETRAQDMRMLGAQDATTEETKTATAELRKGRADGSTVQRAGKIEKSKKTKNKNSGSAAAAAQQAWLAFAKGSGGSGSSKKLKAKAINDKSIFKSPDTVNGKVGVARHSKK